MRPCLLILAAACLAPASVSSAEAVRYRALVQPDGRIELVPDQADGSPTSKAETLAGQDSVVAAFKAPEAGTLGTAYVVTGTDGSQVVVPSLSDVQLPIGATAKAVEVQFGDLSSLVGFSDQQLATTAKEAARALLGHARDAVCDLEPRPRTVTPAVEVSLAALSFTIEAEWETADVCAGPSPGGGQ